MQEKKNNEDVGKILYLLNELKTELSRINVEGQSTFKVGAADDDGPTPAFKLDMDLGKVAGMLQSFINGVGKSSTDVSDEDDDLDDEEFDESDIYDFDDVLEAISISNDTLEEINDGIRKILRVLQNPPQFISPALSSVSTDMSIDHIKLLIDKKIRKSQKKMRRDIRRCRFVDSNDVRDMIRDAFEAHAEYHEKKQ